MKADDGSRCWTIEDGYSERVCVRLEVESRLVATRHVCANYKNYAGRISRAGVRWLIKTGILCLATLTFFWS